MTNVDAAPRPSRPAQPLVATASREVDVLVVGGGQAGLAAGNALLATGLSFLVVEEADAVGGSWPRYYDSLTLFSPSRFSALPGLTFPADPDHYPSRDQVIAYLRAYADHFAIPVRTRSRVQRLAWDGTAFTATVADHGDTRAPAAGMATLRARAVIAASGGFGQPQVPSLSGAETFTGRLLHVADYRRPDTYAGRRVVVVGAGNSAVQVAVELAQVADVSIATRSRVRCRPQRPLGIDLHHWLRWTGIDGAPLGPRAAKATGVVDTGVYAAALAAGRPDRRPMFSRLTDDGVQWADGATEPVDTVLLATGYRPDLPYLADLPALDARDQPAHCHGMSTTVPRLAYVGLPGQRSFASATLRGVGPDARRVVTRLRRQLEGDASKPWTCPAPARAAERLVGAAPG